MAQLNEIAFFSGSWATYHSSVQLFLASQVLLHLSCHLFNNFKVWKLCLWSYWTGTLLKSQGKNLIILQTQKEGFEEEGTHSRLLLLLCDISGLDARNNCIYHCLWGAVVKLKKVNLGKLEQYSVNFGWPTIYRRASLHWSLETSLGNWEILEDLIFYVAKSWPNSALLVFDLKSLP